MSLADMFKTTKTVIKTTINGKEATEEQQKQFDNLWSSFDETMKSFDKTMENFDKTMSNISVSQTDEIELYGSTKEEAIGKANNYSVMGYVLVELKEDDILKVWKAKMKKQKEL